jgi:hypothetical protein
MLSRTCLAISGAKVARVIVHGEPPPLQAGWRVGRLPVLALAHCPIWGLAVLCRLLASGYRPRA